VSSRTAADQARQAQAPVSPAGLAWIVRHTARQPELWRDLVRFDAAERWYARLACDDAHEVWLLTWLPGQQTGFHDHGESAGAFAVASGRLTERAALHDRPPNLGRTLRAGAVRSFASNYVHDVRNDSIEPAVSIHAYSPPLTSMRRYDVTDGGLLRATIEERSW
jgi:predicted metal-dependent enzyme (double-stranded beta helix superfamily)